MHQMLAINFSDVTCAGKFNMAAPIENELGRMLSGDLGVIGEFGVF